MDISKPQDASLEDDMARAGEVDNSERIDEVVRQLRAALHDAAAFRSVLQALADDATLSAREIAAVAQKFVGGTRPKNRKSAVTAIGQERLRQAHAKAKAASAGSTRTW